MHKPTNTMKTTLKTTGIIELDRDDLTKIIYYWLAKEKGYTPSKIQWPKSWPSGEGNRIAAIIDSVVDQKAKPIGKDKKPPKEAGPYEGSTHKWEGLYGAIGDVIDMQRAQKKDFISYDDLRAELLDLEDGKGNRLFIKDDEEIPMQVIRHRLAPSQLIRQSQGQPNLRGVKNDKRLKGLKF